MLSFIFEVISFLDISSLSKMLYISFSCFWIKKYDVKMFKNVPISCFLNTFTPIIQTSTSQTSTRVIFRRKIGASFHIIFRLPHLQHRRGRQKKRRGNFPLLFQKASIDAVLLTYQSSGSAVPRRPCRDGLRQDKDCR